MKVELDLPEWCASNDTPLFVTLGMEVVAYRWPGKKWLIKTGRCSKCGKCCLIGKPKHPCEHLQTIGKEVRCDLGSERPWSCGIHSPVMRAGCEDCTEKFE